MHLILNAFMSIASHIFIMESFLNVYSHRLGCLGNLGTVFECLNICASRVSFKYVFRLFSRFHKGGVFDLILCVSSLAMLSICFRLQLSWKDRWTNHRFLAVYKQERRRQSWKPNWDVLFLDEIEMLYATENL